MPEPALQFGGGGARVVQREEFPGVAVEARIGVAASPPRPGLNLQARDFGGRVEGFIVARTGHGVRHRKGRERGFPAGEENDEGRMERIQYRTGNRRNNSICIKWLTIHRQETDRNFSPRCALR